MRAGRRIRARVGILEAAAAVYPAVTITSSTSNKVSMRKLLFLLALLIPIVIAGCEDSPNLPPGTPSTTGTWVGTTQISGIPFTVTLVLAEAGTNITGSGTLRSPVTPEVSANVTGTHRHPDVTLRLQQPGPGVDVTYQAAFAGDNTITGTLNGNVGTTVLTNQPLTVQRQ
ncbi:hypothetical protein BH20GEM3_BH20GEM3_05910 [soil metagenome]